MQNHTAPKGHGASQSKTKKYRRRRVPSVRILITIDPSLLKLVDEAAEKDYTTRSDLIRMAILWYLRPQGRELDQADPDVILKTLKHRQARMAMKETMKDISIFND